MVASGAMSATEDEPTRPARPTGGVIVELLPDPATAARVVADRVEALLRERASGGQGVVLGLATGRTMEPVHAELVRRHRESGLSFAHVTSFNLDEFHPIAPDDPRSFRMEMKRHLFDRVDLDPARAHVLDGSMPEARVEAACRAWDAQIAAAGGIDLQLLGIGRNGHVGFNEPGSTRASPTRRVELAAATREALAASCGGLPRVPRHALTLGLAGLLAARQLVLLATGAAKARAVARALAGPPGPDCPASLLVGHPGLRIVLDREAAAALPR